MGMLDLHSLIFLCFCLFSPVICLDEGSKDAKFSIFQIIKFQNDPCIGGTRNGTCFTSAECSNAGGTKDGTCADGFGVCCITIISAGASTSLNQSYIVASSTATSGRYTICPCSTDVCRIRFDFTTFTLAGPATNVGSQGASSTNILVNTGANVGDCLTDTFSITGTSGTPIICGTNTGQHVIVDSNGSQCSLVNLGIGGGTTTRALDIMVTQFKCGDDMGGPPGCLQWFTTTTGTVRSFNFPQQAAGATVAASVVHLSNQKYKSCIRKPAGASVLCLAPCTVVAAMPTAIANVAATAQNSFGLSLAASITAQGSNGNACTTDYITIPGGQDNLTVANHSIQGFINRFCGRCLTASATVCTIAVTTSVCTNRTPWQIGVVTDADEVINGTGAVGTSNQAEAALAPGGIMGFSLCYTTL